MPTLPPRPRPSRPGPFATIGALLAQLVEHVRWIGPLRLFVAASGVAVLVVVGWWSLRPPPVPPAPVVDRTETDIAALVRESAAPPGPMLVHVAGAVERAGVVSVEPGARVVDAISAAGGPSTEADLDAINLAAALSDGDHVRVPAIGEPPMSLGSSPGVGAPPGTDASVDVNRAGVEELATLPGIGPVTAAAIVADRAERGPYETVEELLRVRGIGPAKLEALRERVRT